MQGTAQINYDDAIDPIDWGVIAANTFEGQRAALVREGEKVRRAAGDIATAEQLAALASDLEAGVRNSPKVSIEIPVEPKKSVRKSTVNAPDLSLFD